MSISQGPIDVVYDAKCNVAASTLDAVVASVRNGVDQLEGITAPLRDETHPLRIEIIENSSASDPILERRTSNQVAEHVRANMIGYNVSVAVRSGVQTQLPPELGIAGTGYMFATDGFALWQAVRKVNNYDF